MFATDEEDLDPLSFLSFDGLRARERSLARASKARAYLKDAQNKVQQIRMSAQGSTGTFHLEDKYALSPSTRRAPPSCVG